MTELTGPGRKPLNTLNRPFFSSGPCAKPPGWAPEKLATESLGRSHRSKLGKARLQHCIGLIREVLEVPDHAPDRDRTGVGHRRGRDGRCGPCSARAA